MGLKQNIVIKSEYTNNVNSPDGKGSRGASPGQYVMRYMAREDATEVLAPVVLDGYDSQEFTRYMARESATEQLKNHEDTLAQDPDAYGSPLVLKHKFRSMDKLSGRAFGTKGLSLTHEELLSSSEIVQKAFDEGHSVQKVVLSFTEEYLREMGVLSPDFKYRGRGSFKGHVDQLKIRQAIMDGVSRMTTAGKFEDPHWVGTVQLDTAHIHAHLAVVDTKFSKKRMKADGADRGKINEREKEMLRKGIQYSLSNLKDLKGFYGQTSLERQNVVAFVKDHAYATIRENTELQLLLASLPEEKKLWRYGTHNKSMKHPNKLAESIVRGIFEKDPEKSGYKQAIGAVSDYVKEAGKVRMLSPMEEKKMRVRGEQRIIERAVNGLYKTLKTIPDRNFSVRTPMTDIQSASQEELLRALTRQNPDEGFDAIGFALRVKGYGKRREVHKQESQEFFNLARGYDRAKEDGLVDQSSQVMRLYYEEELRYHMALTDKYRKFMTFHHGEDEKNIKKHMPAHEALTAKYKLIQWREKKLGKELTEERKAYTDMLTAYTFQCFTDGVASLKEWDAVMDYDREKGTVTPRFVLPVKPKSQADNLSDIHFKEVKALDVHHLGLDYYNKPDARIDSINAKRFADAYDARSFRVEQARKYVDATGQHLPALDRSISDVGHMQYAVEKALSDGLIHISVDEDLYADVPEEKPRRVTVPVDHSVDTTSALRISLMDINEMDEDYYRGL